jgi:hypothetical protein
MHVDPNHPPSAFAADTALDRPEVFERAMKMYTTTIHEVGVASAVSTRGYGSDALGDGEHVQVATVAHGTGDAAIGPRGVGIAADGTERTHKGLDVSLHEVDVAVGGGLSRATVQGVVRQSFPQFRACYAAGLAKNARLEGRVVVKLSIAADGGVSSAQDGGSTLADDAVVSCVVRNFQLLTFPPPEGTAVSVVYPLVFAPGAER